MKTFTDLQSQWAKVSHNNSDLLVNLDAKLPSLLNHSEEEYVIQGIEMLLAMKALAYILEEENGRIEVIWEKYSDNYHAVQKCVVEEVSQSQSEWFGLFESGCFDRMFVEVAVEECRLYYLDMQEGGDLDLNRLTDLSVEAARELSHWGSEEIGSCYLYLNGLTDLSVEAARELSQWGGHCIYLNGLTDLSVEVACALSEFEGTALHLNGLTDLSVEVAERLAAWESNADIYFDDFVLYLNGLTDLSVEVAEQLSFWGKDESYSYYLILNGLTDLSVEVAEQLAKWKRKGEGYELDLNGLTDSSKEIAKRFGL